jgi:hypothetical protein
VLSFWKFITDFADTAVTLPLAGLMAGFLLTAKHVRVAFAWCLAIVGCAGAIAALKLVLLACRHSLGISDLTSPRGHVAMEYGRLRRLCSHDRRVPDASTPVAVRLP